MSALAFSSFYSPERALRLHWNHSLAVISLCPVCAVGSRDRISRSVDLQSTTERHERSERVRLPPVIDIDTHVILDFAYHSCSSGRISSRGLSATQHESRRVDCGLDRKHTVVCSLQRTRNAYHDHSSKLSPCPTESFSTRDRSVRDFVGLLAVDRGSKRLERWERIW